MLENSEDGPRICYQQGRISGSRIFATKSKNLKNYCDPATMGYHHLHIVDDDAETFSSPGREYLTCLKNTEEDVTNFIQLPTK